MLITTISYRNNDVNENTTVHEDTDTHIAAEHLNESTDPDDVNITSENSENIYDEVSYAYNLSTILCRKVK